MGKHMSYNDDKIDQILKKYNIKMPVCGFYVGNGWLPIVDEALRLMIEAGWDKCLAQVKQKFCGLRIYLGTYQEDIAVQLDNIIYTAEKKCAIVCEECGNPHGLQVPRYGIALCAGCVKQYSDKKEKL